MTNEIQIFNNEELGQIRSIEIDGKIYFVGLDVAKALEYTNPRKAIKDHVDEEDVTKRYPFYTNGGLQRVNIINESKLYSLILASKFDLVKQKDKYEKVKKFKRWITSEVILTRRKIGSYSINPSRIEEKSSLDILIEKVENLNVYINEKITEDNSQLYERNFSITKYELSQLQTNLENFLQSKGVDTYKPKFQCLICGSSDGANFVPNTSHTRWTLREH